MDALISAGGKGTRLIELTGDVIPKPMAKISGKPVIERAVERLSKYGIKKIYISVGHLAEKITSYLKNGEKWGVEIEYITENEPLGSGGALYYLKGKVNGDFVVCSGDTVFDVDLSKMNAYHKRRKALVTMLTHPNAHPYDSDVIICDRFNRVKGISKKNEHQGFYPNNVNAGFFIINSKALDYFDQPKKVNLEHDFILSHINQNSRVYAYKSPEYVKDVGSPQRFFNAEKDIERGLVEARNLSKKQKAIFLDRDGTINEYNGFINTPDGLNLVSDACEAIKKINDSGYLAIVISNQPVIARGEATRGQVEEIFNKMQTLLGRGGAFVDGIFYCPHHPKSGFKGEVKRLKKDCDCRKPKIGMLLSAQKRFNLDLSKCVMVGDSELDVLTANNANIPCVKVKSDLKEKATAIPTAYAETLSDAVAYILDNFKY